MPIRSVGGGNASSLVSEHADVVQGSRNSMLWPPGRLAAGKTRCIGTINFVVDTSAQGTILPLSMPGENSSLQSRKGGIPRELHVVNNCRACSLALANVGPKKHQEFSQ